MLIKWYFRHVLIFNVSSFSYSMIFQFQYQLLFQILWTFYCCFICPLDFGQYFVVFFFGFVWVCVISNALMYISCCCNFMWFFILFIRDFLLFVKELLVRFFSLQLWMNGIHEYLRNLSLSMFLATLMLVFFFLLIKLL